VAATDDDPATLPTRRHKLCSALELAAHSDRSDWRRIVLPQAARVEAQCGELEAAFALFDELRESSIQDGDIGGQHHAVMGAMLQATSRGDYGEGVVAADEMKRIGEEALLDPATVRLMHHGQMWMLRLLFERPRPSRKPATIEIWPLPTMRALALGASAAEVGRSHGAKAGHAILDSITPQQLHDLPRDFYWLPMVSTVAAGCLASAAAAHANALYSNAVAYRSVFVLDPVCIFLGSMEHQLGLLAAAAGDVERAREHLTAAIDAHRRLGCEPWTVRSQRALENLLL
jgi:hypothetical protein